MRKSNQGKDISFESFTLLLQFRNKSMFTVSPVKWHEKNVSGTGTQDWQSQTVTV